MNSGPTAERVYDALKRRIMARAFRPGERLDPAQLADTLASSVTPVRDALHRLTGERLVTTRTGDGFHLPPLDEPGLCDLYGWTCEVLLLAIRGWPPSADPVQASPSAGPTRPCQAAIARLFADVAGRSANVEHVAALSSLNDRLSSVRLVEPQVLEHTEEEIEELQSALVGDGDKSLRSLVTAYHRRRKRHAADIVRATYRTS